MKKVIGAIVALLASAAAGFAIIMMLSVNGIIDLPNLPFFGSETENSMSRSDFRYPVQFQGFYEYEMSFHMGKDTVISHKVIRDDVKKVYIYQYRIRYTGKEDALFRWKVLDRLLGEPVMVHLKSGMTGWKEFKVESEHPPAFYNGEAILFGSKDGVFSKVDSGPRPGPVPGGN